MINMARFPAGSYEATCRHCGQPILRIVVKSHAAVAGRFQRSLPPQRRDYEVDGETLHSSVCPAKKPSVVGH